MAIDYKKHWTEPNGILIIQMPMDWQYKNTITENFIEESPYSFEPYEDPIGCFQLSCYPLSELNPKNNLQKEPPINWEVIRMDSDAFDTYLYWGECFDQALIGKYIYRKEYRDDTRIISQLKQVQLALDSIRVIPPKDRELAASLDKYDRFLASLVASYDLLNAAIESDSYIEIIVLSTNQIDAFLRLAIVLCKQLKTESDEIELRYIFQDEKEKGILERKIFEEAYKLGIVDTEMFFQLNEAYDLRNKIVHRYIISPIKTRDMIPIVLKLLKLHEDVRLILRSYEKHQIGKGYGIYGKGFMHLDKFPDEEVKRAYSWANDKHALERFQRKIEQET